jgi:simple sugar transport system substrate-binding protein
MIPSLFVLVFCVCLLSSSVEATGIRKRRQRGDQLLRIPIESKSRERVGDRWLLEKELYGSDQTAGSDLVNLDFEENKLGRELASFFSMSMSMSMSQNDDISCSLPPAFDGTVQNKIHVIMNINTGEYFELLMDGMIQQASKVENVEIEVFTSQDQNETSQSELIEQAIEDGATGIITVDGSSTTLCDSIRSAIDAGIPVLSFDFDAPDTCAPTGHLLTSQSDSDMADLVLMQAAMAYNSDEDASEVRVGYVNDLHFQPLQNRNVVWEAYSKKYGWDQEFFVQDAASFLTPEDLQNAIIEEFIFLEEKLSNSTISATDVQFVYTPWDYLAINTLEALELIEADVDVYGADINNEDIAAMTKPGSHWKATAGGHPKMIGAAITRMSLLQIASGVEEEGQKPERYIKIPSLLFTQEFLLENNVASLSDLVDVMPELRLEDTANACWIAPID